MDSDQRGGALGRAPLPLRIAAVLVGLQGLATAAYAGGELLHVTSSRAVMGGTTAVFFAVYGVGLVVAGWGMWTLRTWSRGPVLLAELIWLGLAWSFRQGGTRPLSALLTVVAVVTLIGVLHPASVEALNREEHRRH